jgi:signal transduction histidine kinase
LTAFGETFHVGQPCDLVQEGFAIAIRGKSMTTRSATVKAELGAASPRRSAVLELVASPASAALDHAQLAAKLQELLEFERIVSNLSKDIDECSADLLDARLGVWLERLARFLNVESAVLFEYSPETNVFRAGASYCSAGQGAPPAVLRGDAVPVTARHLLRGESYRYETRAAMPASDRWVYDELGVRSVLGLPLSIEGVAMGCVLLGARERRTWPDEMVSRLQVIAHIFANAVARKHAEQARRVQRELAEALEFRELVIGILSHDLRSPLSAATALTQLVLRQEGLPDVLRRRVTAVSSSMDRMNDLIGTLLDFTESRFKGAMTISRTKTDLERTCERVVSEQLAVSPARTILQRCEGPTEGDWDPVRMEQLVSNLLSNALKHGDLTRPVELELRDEGRDGILLQVTNFGAPIAPDVLGKLFEPFRRGPMSERGGRRGLGLGLYIVRQIALAHGGSVAVESTQERGTTFTVRLPRSGGATAPTR